MFAVLPGGDSWGDMFCKQFTAEIEALEQPKLVLLKYS